MKRVLKGVDIAHLSSALRKLATAASPKLGSDCFLHASLVKELLEKDFGIKSELKIGFAAWRVGSGNGDVILHAPMADTMLPEKAIPFHAWLEVSGHILDLTLYQLELKAEALDIRDGGNTSVEWCPDYLFAPSDTVSTLPTVVDGEKGTYYYQPSLLLERKILNMAVDAEPQDVEMLRRLYSRSE